MKKWIPKNQKKYDPMLKHMNVGVVGLGLIGASVAKALKKADPRYTIVGIDNEQSVIDYAFKYDIIDYGGVEKNLLLGCQVIFVAVPAFLAPRIIAELFELVGDNALITDVSGVKSEIYAALPRGIRFIGGHPMAGSEKAGIRESKAELFENAYYFITDYKVKESKDKELILSLVTAMKAKPLFCTPKEHDEAAAKISHLPHLIAYALTASSIDGEITSKAAAGGFRDITRIASSEPSFWSSLMLKNRANILSSLDVFTKEINEIRSQILKGDEAALTEIFSGAKQKRDAIEKTRANFLLNVELSDAPNALGKITSKLGKSKINIANIRIVNSREEQSGALLLEFYDEESLNKAATLLKVKRSEE